MFGENSANKILQQKYFKMKKLLFVGVVLIGLISFTGCYSGRAVVVERPPVRRVYVAPPAYYYSPAPVVVAPYVARGYYKPRGRRRSIYNGYRRY